MESSTVIFNYYSESKSKKAKKKFTSEEDEIIVNYVQKHGAKNWRFLTTILKNRTSRQIRERWVNYLDPNVSHGEWTKEEDELILELFNQNGTKWSVISKSFLNRTDVMIKNRFQLLKRHLNKGFLKKNGTVEQTIPFQDGEKDIPQVFENNEDYIFDFTEEMFMNEFDCFN